MFVPGLKYLFCIPRVYESNHIVPMLRYLNNIGVIPPVLIGSPGVYDVLEKERIVYYPARDLPANYDIFITCGQGYIPFDRYWLEKSMEAGKINLEFMLYSSLNNSKVPFYVPKRTKFLHAMFVNDKKTSDSIKSYNKEILHFHCGSPVWDKYSTDEFRQDVAEAKNRYGEKLLVIGDSGHQVPEERGYCRDIIQWGQELGFKVLLQLHPECAKNEFPTEQFEGNINTEFSNHAIFAAASHVISLIHSAMISESLYLGANVACTPLAATTEGFGNVFWSGGSKQWYEWARTCFDDVMLEILPLVHDHDSLADFLISGRGGRTRQTVESVFDWPKVPSITEHIFKTVEANFGKDNQENVEMVLRKNPLSKGFVVDFSFWDTENDLSKFYDVNNLQDFIKGGIQFLDENRTWDAVNFFRRAEMFSGTSHFEFVQYALAMSYFMVGNIEEANGCIHRSLFFKPNKPEYLALKAKIDEAKNCAEVV